MEDRAEEEIRVCGFWQGRSLARDCLGANQPHLCSLLSIPLLQMVAQEHHIHFSNMRLRPRRLRYSYCRARRAPFRLGWNQIEALLDGVADRFVVPTLYEPAESLQHQSPIKLEVAP